MQTYLVAGGAGFIGSHLCESLISKGNKVICYDNLITGSKQNISHLQKNENFNFVNQDITKPFILEQKIDAIFHLASPASPNKKSPLSYINHPIETLLVNSLGTYNLLELAKSQNIRFLYASTSEIYGNPKVSPQREDYFGNVNPNGIRSVYDEGKRFGEAMTMAYFRKYSMDIRIVRIFNTYGPKMQKEDGRVISNFIIQALKNDPITIYGEGLQTRSFCYITDMIEGLVLMMESENAKGEVINLGNPDEHTILEMASLIKKLTSSSSEVIHEALPEDDPEKRHPDITKAKEILGFEPKVELEKGLTNTVQYFKEIL